MRSAFFHFVRQIQQVGLFVSLLAIACVSSTTRLRAQAGDEPDAAREASQSAAPTPSSPQPQPVRITCSSTAGTREHCAADTSVGVILARSTGGAACLLGKTWGYDDTGIWVSDGCSAEFVVGSTSTGAPEKAKPLEHIPNVGFLLYDGEKGQIYFRLFSYARYLNQRSIDTT